MAGRFGLPSLSNLRRKVDKLKIYLLYLNKLVTPRKPLKGMDFYRQGIDWEKMGNIDRGMADFRKAVEFPQVRKLC